MALTHSHLMHKIKRKLHSGLDRFSHMESKAPPVYAKPSLQEDGNADATLFCVLLKSFSTRAEKRCFRIGLWLIQTLHASRQAVVLLWLVVIS